MDLRPAGPDDEAFLAHVRRPEIAGEFNSFGEPGETPAAADIGRMIVVLDDGTPIGSVSWHRVGYGPNRRSRARNIGITIAPEHRGRGRGTAAQRMLATIDANRVEASTDTRNVAEQRALERAGFRREGVLGGWVTDTTC